MIVRRLFLEAARRIAQNPEVQHKAADMAAQVYVKARPKLENAGRHLSESARDAAAEHDPLKDPLGFARSLKKRAFPPEN
jgi:alkylation response protein AidB-like acyl-CoA dehydrogenase